MYQLDIASIREAGSGVPGTRVWQRVSRTVLLLGIVSCLTDISSEMVSSALPIYLLAHLQFSALQFGFIDGLYQGVSAFARLASGVIADRGQRYKWVAAIGYGLSAVCKLGLFAVGPAPMALAALIAVDRTGKGIRTAPRDALISLSARASEQATAFGVHRAFDTIGVVAGPLLTFFILRRAADAFDMVFVLSFAIALVGLGVLILLVDESREAVESPKASLSAIMAVAADPNLRKILAIGALLNLTVMSDAFLYLIIQQRGGSLLENLPLFYVVTSVAFLAFAVPAGRLADRFGRARVYLAGHLVVLALYGAALSFELNPVTLGLCLVLHGLYYAATDGVLAALASGLVPRDVLASSLGAVATATSLARLVGSILIGALWTWSGPSAVLIFGLAGTLAVIVFASTSLLRLDARTSGQAAS